MLICWLNCLHFSFQSLFPTKGELEAHYRVPLLCSVTGHCSAIFYIERSQLTWFGHLTSMPPGSFLGEVFRACPAPSRSLAHPGLTGCWGSCLCSDSCPCNAKKDKQQKIDEWMDEHRLCIKAKPVQACLKPGFFVMTLMRYFLCLQKKKSRVLK